MMESKVASNSKQKEKNRKIWLVLLLGSLTAFGPLSMDMYLPALPTVTSDMQTTASLAQLSLTACLLGLAGGQLLFGPLSDMKGRRRPLLFTLIMYAVASLFCAFSPNIWLFVAMRFIQGFSAAAGIVIARAAARDLYNGKDLTKFMAMLALVTGAAPILAPIFGGVMLEWFNWPYIFIMLSLIGFLMFFGIVFMLPETLPEEKRSEASILAIVNAFGHLLKDKIFLKIALTQGFISIVMFAYIAGSPFVLQNIYDVTAQQFSLIFALNGVGIIIASQTTGRLASKTDEVKLLLGGILLSLIGSTFLFIVVLFHLPLWVIIISLFLAISSVGIVNTTSFSLALQRQGNAAGSASAFLGILPFGGGAIVSPLVGIGGKYTAMPMGVTIFVSSLVAFGLYLLLVRGVRTERKNSSTSISLTRKNI